MAAAEIQPSVAPQPALAPVRPVDRIYNLDMLRGWAILVEGVLGAVLFVVWRRAHDAPDPDWAA